MNRTLRKSTLLGLVVLLALTLTACENWRERAAIYMRDFQVSLEAVQDAEMDVFAAGYISAADHMAFQKQVIRIAEYGERANEAIRAGNRQSTILQIDLALRDLDAMQREGLLAVQNDQSKAALSGLILAVRGVLTGARVAVE